MQGRIIAIEGGLTNKLSWRGYKKNHFPHKLLIMSDTVIQDGAALQQLCEVLGRHSWIALDTEFIRDRTYYTRLCLIQVAVPGNIACIDPLALPDLKPFLDIVYEPAIIKVMHSGRQDLEIFYDLCGTLPKPVFDTQLAAALAGYGDQAGYAQMVETVLGIKLNKAHTRTDWCRRPLGAAQIRYAEDDVRHLRDLYLHLSGEIASMGRAQWLAEESEWLTDPATYRNDPREAYRNIKDGHLLPPANQNILRELAGWRERCAQEHDLPRSWVVPDPVLFAVARDAPQDQERLGRIEGLSKAATTKWSGNIIKAIRMGAARRPAPVWKTPLRLTGEQKALCNRLMAVVRKRAEQNKLPPAVLGTRREVKRFIAGDTEASFLHGWRRRLVGAELLEMTQE